MLDYLDIIKPDSTVGIIDADLLDGGTRHPNLALMKISGYCKDQGCYVELLRSYDEIPEYDIVFVSRVFTFTSVPEDILELDNVYCGGTGFYEDGGDGLPDEIEHHMPDYSLYEAYVNEKIKGGRKRAWFADYLDYSIGFTTRGCFRKCDFCVNKKYDKVFRHSPVGEFLDEERPYIYLWDDNFLAFSGWEEILDELIATEKPFQFRQGLDIRLLTSKKAEKLSHVRYCGDFIFAFDHIEDKELIEKKLALWRAYADRGTRLYVLCAFDSQDEKDIENVFKRIKVLMRFGCLPYIMRYESYKNSRWRSLYVNIARWCNQPQFFKKKSFRQFCEANQEYHKNKETRCSAYASMLDFEEAFPEIASRYFDLRYEEENMAYYYGRSALLQPQEECDAMQSAAWNALRNGADVARIVADYYNKRLDTIWLSLDTSLARVSEDAERLFGLLRDVSLEETYHILREYPSDEPITPANIPQFSDMSEVIHTANKLCLLDTILSYRDLGMYLAPEGKKSDVAHRKYGENHGKLAALMDIVSVERKDGKVGCAIAPFTRLFDALDEESKWELLAKLTMRIPIVRIILRDAENGRVFVSDYLNMLSESTKQRRIPNVMRLFELIEEHCAESGSELMTALGNVERQR